MALPDLNQIQTLIEGATESIANTDGVTKGETKEDDPTLESGIDTAINFNDISSKMTWA